MHNISSQLTFDWLSLILSLLAVEKGVSDSALPSIAMRRSGEGSTPTSRPDRRPPTYGPPPIKLHDNILGWWGLEEEDAKWHCVDKCCDAMRESGDAVVTTLEVRVSCQKMLRRKSLVESRKDCSIPVNWDLLKGDVAGWTMPLRVNLSMRLRIWERGQCKMPFSTRKAVLANLMGCAENLHQLANVRIVWLAKMRHWMLMMLGFVLVLGLMSIGRDRNAREEALCVLVTPSSVLFPFQALFILASI